MNEMSATRFLTLIGIGVFCTALIYSGATSPGDGILGGDGTSDGILTPPKEPIFRFHLSSDESAYFGCSRRPGFFLRDVTTGKEIARYDYDSQVPIALDVSPDDRLVVVVYKSREVVAWSRENRNLRPRRLCTLSNSGYCCQLSADQRFAAFGCDDGTVEIVEIATGRREARFFTGHSAVRCVRFAPDGGKLLASSFDGRIGLYNTATGRLVRNFVGHTKQVRTLDWSENGTSFVSGGNDGTARWWAIDQSEPLWTIRLPDSVVAAAALSADGNQILVGGSQIGCVVICDVPTRTVIETVLGKTSNVCHVRFSRRSPTEFFYVTMSTNSAVHRDDTRDLMSPLQ